MYVHFQATKTRLSWILHFAPCIISTNVQPLFPETRAQRAICRVPHIMLQLCQPLTPHRCMRRCMRHMYHVNATFMPHTLMLLSKFDVATFQDTRHSFEPFSAQVLTSKRVSRTTVAVQIQIHLNTTKHTYAASLTFRRANLFAFCFFFLRATLRIHAKSRISANKRLCASL